MSSQLPFCPLTLKATSTISNSDLAEENILPYNSQRIPVYQRTDIIILQRLQSDKERYLNSVVFTLCRHAGRPNNYFSLIPAPISIKKVETALSWASPLFYYLVYSNESDSTHLRAISRSLSDTGSSSVPNVLFNTLLPVKSLYHKSPTAYLPSPIDAWKVSL